MYHFIGALSLLRNRRSLIPLLSAALVVAPLFALLSACNARPSEQAVAEAIEQTRAAEASIQALIDTRVAAALTARPGGQGQAETSPVATAAPVGPGEAAIQATIDSQVETKVAAAVADLIQQQTFEAGFATPTDDSVAAAGSGGGGTCGASVCAEVIDGISLNVREGPGEEYQIIDALRPDDGQVPVIARGPDGWINIRVDGRPGWVSGDFVSLNVMVSTVPMAATIPATPRVFATVTPTPTPAPSATNTPTATPTATPTKQAARVIVINDSSLPVCRLEIFQVTETSGSNRLTDPPLVPGSRLTVSLTGDISIYDFKAWSCEGDLVAEQLGATIFDGFIWTIMDSP